MQVHNNRTNYSTKIWKNNNFFPEDHLYVSIRQLNMGYKQVGNNKLLSQQDKSNLVTQLFILYTISIK